MDLKPDKCAGSSKPARANGSGLKKPDIAACAPGDPTDRREAFLASMCSVPAAVTVVTTDGPAGRHGATVSAFCSVSADPPTVLVCLKTDSEICRRVLRNGCFTVNILHVISGSEQIARTFAGQFDDRLADRFRHVPLSSRPEVAPAIEGSTAMACRLVKSDNQASHTVCYGEVVLILEPEERAEPLAYYNRNFGTFAPLALSGDQPKDRFSN